MRDWDAGREEIPRHDAPGCGGPRPVHGAGKREATGTGPRGRAGQERQSASAATANRPWEACLSQGNPRPPPAQSVACRVRHIGNSSNRRQARFGVILPVRLSVEERSSHRGRAGSGSAARWPAVTGRPDREQKPEDRGRGLGAGRVGSRRGAPGPRGFAGRPPDAFVGPPLIRPSRDWHSGRAGE
jgi:hypothetical protein